MLLVTFNSPFGKSVTCPRFKRGVTLAMDGTIKNCGSCDFYHCIAHRQIRLTADGVEPTTEMRECVDCRWEESK